MQKIKRIKQLLYISIICVFIYSGTIPLMPLASDMSNKTNKMSVIILGMIFWLSFINAYISLFLANRVRKSITTGKQVKGRIGLFRFFSNRLGIVADILLLLSVVIFIISLFTPMANHWIIYIFLFFIVLSLNLHCIFNGKIYDISKSQLD